MLSFLSNWLYRLEADLFPPAIPVWIQVAKREIGVREVRGGENPRIIEYHSKTSLKATEDEVPWCSSFVNWVCWKCELERSGSAAARSWLGYGKRLPGFRKYAIVVLRRGNSSWQGHVGFAMADLGNRIQVLGGNQADKVGYANYPKSDVLSYLWPAPESATLIRPLA